MRIRNWKIGDIINIKAVVGLLYGIVIGHNGIIDKTNEMYAFWISEANDN